MLRYKRAPPVPGRAKRQARAPSPQLTLISLSCHLNCDSSARAPASYSNLVPVFDTQHPAPSIPKTVADRRRPTPWALASSIQFPSLAYFLPLRVFFATAPTVQ